MSLSPEEKSQKFSVKFNHVAICYYQNIYTPQCCDLWSSAA